MEIKAFSQDFLIEHLKGKKKQLNPEEIAVIRISSNGLKDLPVEIPEENVAVFNFADIEEEDWENEREKLLEAEERQEEATGIRPRFSPITEEEAEEIVLFVKKMKEKGVNTLLIHCDEGICRSQSVAFAVARFVLKDERLANRFLDNPTAVISLTIVRKIALKEGK